MDRRAARNVFSLALISSLTLLLSKDAQVYLRPPQLKRVAFIREQAVRYRRVAGASGGWLRLEDLEEGVGCWGSAKCN
jgi:hypothetical protein